MKKWLIWLLLAIQTMGALALAASPQTIDSIVEDLLGADPVRRESALEALEMQPIPATRVDLFEKMIRTIEISHSDGLVDAALSALLVQSAYFGSHLSFPKSAEKSFQNISRKSLNIEEAPIYFLLVSPLADPVSSDIVLDFYERRIQDFDKSWVNLLEIDRFLVELDKGKRSDGRESRSMQSALMTILPYVDLFVLRFEKGSTFFGGLKRSHQLRAVKIIQFIREKLASERKSCSDSLKKH